MAKLTPKQAIFYGEYIKDSNATRAAIAAGYPESSAHVAGNRLLKNPKVAAAIDVYRQSRKERYEAAADEVLQTLTDLLRADVGNLYDRDGARIPVHKLDDVTRAAIMVVEDETTTSADKMVTRKQRVRMADKIRVGELLGKYHKLFTDRIEHDGRVTLEQLICGTTDKSEAA